MPKLTFLAALLLSASCLSAHCQASVGLYGRGDAQATPRRSLKRNPDAPRPTDPPRWVEGKGWIAAKEFRFVGRLEASSFTANGVIFRDYHLNANRDKVYGPPILVKHAPDGLATGDMASIYAYRVGVVETGKDGTARMAIYDCGLARRPAGATNAPTATLPPPAKKPSDSLGK